MIKDFFEATAWEMTPPISYGPFHITFFVIGLTLSILIANHFRNSDEKTNRRVLLFCGIFLIISEIYKQLFYYYVIGNNSYQWWIFPFQLCSIPMYFCVISPFIKNKKIQNMLYNFLMVINFFGGFVAFLEPSGLVHEYYTLTFHAFVWHMMLVFIGLYLWRSGRAGNTIKDYFSAIPIYLGSAVIAEIINIIFRDKPGINMFYISPYNNSPIIVFKDICAKYGWYVNAPLFLFSILLGAFIFFIIFLNIKKIINKKEVIKLKKLEALN